MSNYYSIVDIENKEVYGLGTTNSAKEKLPILAKKLKTKMLCFYGNESYPRGEDKYETFYNNEGFGEPWGAKYFDKGEAEITLEDVKNCTTLTREQFELVVDELECKEINDLYEQILKIINRK